MGVELCDEIELRKYFNSMLRLSFRDLYQILSPNPKFAGEVNSTLSYIAGFMTDFAASENTFIPTRVQGRLEDMDKFLRKRVTPDSGDYVYRLKKSGGDMSLFLLGLFPEILDRSDQSLYYADVMASCYNFLSSRYGFSNPCFKTLGQNPFAYKKIINHTRDKFMMLVRSPDDSYLIDFSSSYNSDA